MTGHGREPCLRDGRRAGEVLDERTVVCAAKTRRIQLVIVYVYETQEKGSPPETPSQPYIAGPICVGGRALAH